MALLAPVSMDIDDVVDFNVGKNPNRDYPATSGYLCSTGVPERKIPE